MFTIRADQLIEANKELKIEKEQKNLGEEQWTGEWMRIVMSLLVGVTKGLFNLHHHTLAI